MSKVIIITGASRGIGRAIAEKLARTGNKIIANYNNSKEKAEEQIVVAKEFLQAVKDYLE